VCARAFGDHKVNAEGRRGEVSDLGIYMGAGGRGGGG